jgi:hypothetical protein
MKCIDPCGTYLQGVKARRGYKVAAMTELGNKTHKLVAFFHRESESLNRCCLKCELWKIPTIMNASSDA